MSGDADLSDEVVIERVLGGDVDVFGVLVERYRLEFRRYAVSLCGDVELAADAMQEAFVRAYESLATCRDPSRFKAWFFRILTNQCHNARKRQGKRIALESVERTAGQHSDDGVYRSELRIALARALDALKPELRQAFVMRHVEGRSYAEMADLFATSEDAQRMRVYRARDELRNLLDGVL